MAHQVVEFVALDNERTTFEDVFAFEYREDKPYKWLHKLCLKILRKIGAYHLSNKINIMRRSIDTDDVIKCLFEQRKELCHYFHEDGKTLLIGSEDFAELMGNPSLAASMRYSFQCDYRTGKYQVLGLNVEGIPWMRGMLVMP